MNRLNHAEPKRKPKVQTINDTDRAQWLDNDEGLYCMWKSSGMGKYAFVRENRAMITTAIRNVADGTKPAHYLRYGG